jgi:hypothetical protein
MIILFLTLKLPLSNNIILIYRIDIQTNTRNFLSLYHVSVGLVPRDLSHFIITLHLYLQHLHFFSFFVKWYLLEDVILFLH